MVSIPSFDKPRDGDGKFVKEGTDPAKTVVTDVKAESPIKIITKKPDPLDEPLVKLSIQNPFKKILHWLNDIRKKQTTTFDFKIKIPLIALPIFLIILIGAFQTFFQLGKQKGEEEILLLPTPTPIVITQPTTIPEPVLISKLGTIKATYSTLESSPTPIEENDITPTVPVFLPPPIRYILVDKNDIVISLIAPASVNLRTYLNLRVIITGYFDSQKGTLTVRKASDIEVVR